MCGPGSVLEYRNVLPNGTSPSNYGVDIGYYYLGYGGIYGNLAKVTIIAAPQDDAENAGKSCPIVGQPVNVSNGSMWLEQTDFKLPGLGEEIEITRFYNSLIQTNGMFGTGWSTKYDESLQFYGDYLVRLNMPDGRAVYLARETTTSVYMPVTPEMYGFITQNADGTFTLTFKDGRKHQFNSNGTLQWQRDRKGNQTTLNYDTNNVLTEITDASGRTLTVGMSNGLVQSLSDSLGVIATYTYFSGTNHLKDVTYQDGSKFKFEYDTTTVAGKTFLKTVRDANDKITETHEYDAQGRATTSEKEGGVEKYTFDYSNWGLQYPYSPYTLVKHKKNASDPNFVETKYFFNKDNGKNYIWKTEGNCNCGSGSEVTTFEYDDRLNLKKKTDALGRQTTFTYNYQGDVLTKTDVLGTETYTYNSFGKVLTKTDRMNGTTTNTYDASGNLLTMTDALNNTTTFTYNPQGQIQTVTDARNNTTTLTYDAQGKLTQVKDANNKTTNYGYDARARITSVTNALNYQTSFEYDLNNRLKKVIYPDTKFEEYTYDLAGRRTQAKDARGNITTFGYDDAYRLTSVTDALNHTTMFGYDLMSNRMSAIDALGNATNYEYDDFNRLKKVVYPPAVSGGTRLEERLEYDSVGNVKKRIDTANRETVYDYDAANRLFKITDALNQITQFEYNNRSQMTKVKDALNQEYVFAYDPLGRQLSQTRAGTTMSFEYDAVGNRTKRTDYTGRVTDYVYDNLNRVTQINYVNQSTANATYVYDDLSRLTSATNGAGTVSFTYDNRNRIATTTDVFGHLINYGYDENGNRNLLKFNNADYATYAYDVANRLTAITNVSDNTNIAFGYDNANKPTTKTLPNGIQTTYNYDGMSRLTELKDFSATATLFDRQYAYNAASQINQITESPQIRNFGYDNVDRLTSMTSPTLPSETYNFNVVGNRTSSHRSATYNYQPNTNLLTMTATATYVYDANGNMTSKNEGVNSWRYTWDYENRLTSATLQRRTAKYVYDALGRRVRREMVGERDNVKFIYDGLDVLVDDDGKALTKYLNGEGIDNKLRMQTGSSVKYFLTDHLGSTNGLADASGNLTSSTNYDSFGNASNAAFPTRYQFTGREFDSFTGLHYYRARYYDANLGRFISEDPIGFAGGDVNLFGYVKNKNFVFRFSVFTSHFSSLISHFSLYKR